MTRIIRLTERDLTNIVKQVIKEEEKIESFSNFKKAVTASKNFFKNEVFSMVTKEQISKLNKKVNNINLEKLINNLDDKENASIDEGYINENIVSKIKNYISNLGIYVGGITAAGSIISFAGEISGWSQSEIMTKIHEINEQYLGMGRSNGPFVLLIGVLGIILALVSYSKRETYKDKNK